VDPFDRRKEGIAFDTNDLCNAVFKREDLRMDDMWDLISKE
jgi:hypothetical protein